MSQLIEHASLSCWYKNVYTLNAKPYFKFCCSFLEHTCHFLLK